MTSAIKLKIIIRKTMATRKKIFNIFNPINMAKTLIYHSPKLGMGGGYRKNKNLKDTFFTMLFLDLGLKLQK